MSAIVGTGGLSVSFIDAITGFVAARGSVMLDLRDVSKLPPRARARRGLAPTWQSIELFDDVSVGS